MACLTVPNIHALNFTRNAGRNKRFARKKNVGTSNRKATTVYCE